MGLAKQIMMQNETVERLGDVGDTIWRIEDRAEFQIVDTGTDGDHAYIEAEDVTDGHKFRIDHETALEYTDVDSDGMSRYDRDAFEARMEEEDD